MQPTAGMNPDQMKKQVADKPSNIDVHEQRAPNQPREGVVPNAPPRAPTPSEVDEQRADWEGMQPQPSKP